MIGFTHFHWFVRGILSCVTGLMCIVFTIHADQSPDTSIDCSSVNVDFTENPEWTRQEKIKAMNKAFYESVQRFQVCQLSNQSNGLSSTTNSGAQNSAEGHQPQSASGQTTMNSASSPVLTGTEPTSSQENDASISDNSNTNDSPDKPPVASNTTVMTNGKTPEDIPDANNDDAIASQIRLAAEIENDPDKKARLWNEYRKYKGLPTR